MTKNVVENPHYFQALVDAIRDFCLMIEHASKVENRRWLADIGRILPRIKLAMAQLDIPNSELKHFSLSDLDDRFELFCRLRQHLGEFDAYWLEYDPSTEREEMSGSLAGDFADIYFELRRGLNLLKSDAKNQKHALKIWQSGYTLNWGQRLMDAERHIFALKLSGKL